MKAIKILTYRNDLVLDPFAGSGTTLYVARRMGMHYLGIEVNPAYVELARKRLVKNKFVEVAPSQVQLHSLVYNNPSNGGKEK